MFRALFCLVLLFIPLCSAAGVEPFKQYYVAFLYKGPQFAAAPADSPQRKANHENHLAFIKSMTASGRMILFGPILDAGDLRGMYVFKADSLEQAKEWANQEPSVKIGMIEMKVYPWLGPSSLGGPPK